MSSPADRPDLLRLLAQKIFGEQARLFPWEEREPESLMQSNRPAELRPAQRERPSDLRDMDMGELGRWIAEQEEAQKAGAAEAIHNMPASPVAGLVAAMSPDTYANMAETEGPGGEAPTMAAALTGLETTGGPGHPLTPRMEGPAAPGGRRAPSKITGIPLPDPRMKGMPIDHLKNEHTARWWDKFERAQEAGPVALEKARDAAKKDWDTRFRQWQISNEPPQQGVVDQDFTIPSEGSATGVTPTMFQPAKETRPARPAGATPVPKPEKPKFIDPSAVSVVAEPLPEPPPTPPGGITVEAIEGKPGAWRIRDPKSGLEQEFVGDRETADKHAKWLAQLSLRAEAREKLKAAKAAEKPKPAEPPKAEEPPAEPAPRPDLAPNNPERDAAEALVRRTAELQKKQLEGTATPEEIAEINANIESNRTANRARMAPKQPLTDAEAAKLIEESNRPAPGFEQDPTPERVAQMMGEPAPPPAEPPAMTTGGGSLAPQGLPETTEPPSTSGRPATRGQKKPKYSADKPVVGRRSAKKAPAPTEKEQSEDFSGVGDRASRRLMSLRTAPTSTGLTKLTVPEPPPGPPGESALNRTLGLKYTAKAARRKK